MGGIFKVSIKTTLRIRENGLKKDIQIRSNNMKREISDKVIKILRKHAPRGQTGFLAKSIRIIGDKTRSQRDILEGSIVIGPTAPYTKMVIGGTKSSDGRYVPAVVTGGVIPVLGGLSSMGFRLKNGNRIGKHPGTKPNPFVRKATHEINAAVGSIVKKNYNTYSFDRFIKGRLRSV